jgi:hypothetical protein
MSVGVHRPAVPLGIYLRSAAINTVYEICSGSL